MTEYMCRKCNRRHVRIQQAVPEKPTGYYRDLLLDFVVILMVFASVLLWVGVMS